LEIKLVNITNKTLYTSPYLVVNDQEYTKHFYAESQRLASKLGAGLASSVVDPLSYQVGEITSSYENKRDSLSDLLERGWSRTAVGSADIEAGNVSIESTEFNVINELAESSANEPESDLYFYHSDHLGSSSWITSASGAVDQHLQYLPFATPKAFGDIYQRSSSWDVPYTFSGKEKDAETGYSYTSTGSVQRFGASPDSCTGYDSDLSVWLSVDPLSDKLLSLSPYNFNNLNPLRYIDLDGMMPGDTISSSIRVSANSGLANSDVDIVNVQTITNVVIPYVASVTFYEDIEYSISIDAEGNPIVKGEMTLTTKIYQVGTEDSPSSENTFTASYSQSYDDAGSDTKEVIDMLIDYRKKHNGNSIVMDAIRSTNQYNQIQTSGSNLVLNITGIVITTAGAALYKSKNPYIAGGLLVGGLGVGVFGFFNNHKAIEPEKFSITPQYLKLMYNQMP
jgi:RHS repeat-associated protein